MDTRKKTKQQYSVIIYIYKLKHTQFNAKRKGFIDVRIILDILSHLIQSSPSLFLESRILWCFGTSTEANSDNPDIHALASHALKSNVYCLELK